ncbi:MAG: hypothetical protein ACYC0F_19205 [Rhodanobacter sp.]
MLAPALAAALSGPRDRLAASPFSHSAADASGAGAAGPASAAAQGRALAPLLARAVAPAPAGEGGGFPGLGGSTDWLDLSHAAQSFLAGFRAGSGADSIAGELLAGDVGRYLDAALKQLAAEMEKVFGMLGMPAADAGAAAAGLAAPMAGPARDSVASLHLESQRISASSEVTATGSRQSLSLVMQSLDIAIDRKSGTVTITQQRLSVSVEIRTGDRVQTDPLFPKIGDDGAALEAMVDRLFDPDGDGRTDRPAWMQGDMALLRLDRADGPADAPSDDGILRLRLDAVLPLGLALEDGRLVIENRLDRAGDAHGAPEAARVDLEA